MTTTDQTDWLSRLSQDSMDRDDAIQELRDYLVRGLTAAGRNRFSGKIQIDDVVQDALIKILDKLDTFQGRSKFTTWAMTIAIRIAISETRRKSFQDVSMNDLLENSLRFEVESAPEPPSDRENEKARLLNKLSELIESSLSSKQREAMQALLNGMPVEIFAEKTGSNRNAVYKLVHDARVKLRQGFEQAGYNAADISSVFG